MSGRTGRARLLSDAEFVEAARAALDELPAEITDQMANIAVVVEERSAHGNVLGLYHGVPLTRRGYFHDSPPDRITLYREAIESICDTPGQARREIRKTVLHEVGHHFGLGEQKLRELGYG